jgi:hypothetical protein
LDAGGSSFDAVRSAICALEVRFVSGAPLVGLWEAAGDSTTSLHVPVHWDGMSCYCTT